MKVLIFGTGKYYEKFKHYFTKHQIVSLLDNDTNKIGQKIDDVYVESPIEGIKKYYDKIFVLSASYYEMEKQLLKLGVTKSKICSVYDIRKICGFSFCRTQLKIYDSNNGNNMFARKRKKIAIVTRGIGVNGGDFTVLLAAEVLKDIYDVFIVSGADGELRNKFLKMGISVIIDEDLMVESLSDARWSISCELIIVNGSAQHNLFYNRGQNACPVIWWIHSSGEMERNTMLYRLREENVSKQGIYVFGVSNRAMKSFSNLVPEWGIQKLCYGIHDFDKMDMSQGDKIVFALIGSCQSRKAQDVFLDAIQMLPNSKKEMCEFWLVGPMDDTKFSRKIRARINGVEHVKILGVLENSKLQKIYQKISILVCPSLEDTMPIVCAEAMMHRVPCIVSDCTGTAEYILPRENGLICKAGDVEDLSMKMQWIMDHPQEIRRMGENARKLYEKHFTFEAFANRLQKIISERLAEK